MSQSARIAAVSTIISALCLGAVGCGGDEVKYTPHPASSGAKAATPPVANLPKTPLKAGDAWTVWGASYSLRSRVHHKDVEGKIVSITGYITKTNLADAPVCAVHKGGKEDPQNCLAPIPTFWIGDSKDAAEADCIKVMGWASNYAQIFDAIEEFDKGKKDAEFLDAKWGVKVPNPLPAVGAKVTVKGTYGTTFNKASNGAEADPFMGIVEFQEMSIPEPAPELATLPGVKRREPRE